MKDDNKLQIKYAIPETNLQINPGWRKEFEEGRAVLERVKREKLPERLPFNDDAKGLFLAHLARFGRLTQAAAYSGFSSSVVRKARDDDPVFNDALEEALNLYRDRVKQAVYEQSIEGVEKPIFGGKYKDEQVGSERIYAPYLLLAEAKRVDPEYRDKQQLDVKVSGGVLHIPIAPTTAEEWEKSIQAIPAVPQGLPLPPPKEEEDEGK